MFGNKYYREKGPESLKERRWVVYKGMPEASKVPAQWHGWLHHLLKSPPPIEEMERWPWEKCHLPNLSGTSYAYTPRGLSGKRHKATGDYEAWKPHREKDENEFA